MKTSIFLIAFILPVLIFSQESTVIQNNEVNTGFSWGFQLNQYQKDFGLGVTLQSPTLFNKSFAFKMRGNYMYFEHVDSLNQETTWTPYYNVTFGMMSIGAIVKNFLKLYGEGGVILLLPSEKFSSESVNIGGYGVFGFEFFMDRMNSYFIEIGGVGTGANADKVQYSPIYSNGMSISVGYKMTF